MVRRLGVDIRHCVCKFHDYGCIFIHKELYNCISGRQCRMVNCNGASLPSRAPRVLERCLWRPEMILEGANPAGALLEDAIQGAEDALDGVF